MSEETHGTVDADTGPGPGRPAVGAGDGRWELVRQSEDFRALVRAKRRFIVPATIFFLVWCLLLPLGNGLAPSLMKTKVVGNINLAYLFALSEFLMTWAITYLYIRRSEGVFDGLAARVRERIGAVAR